MLFLCMICTMQASLPYGSCVAALSECRIQDLDPCIDPWRIERDRPMRDSDHITHISVLCSVTCDTVRQLDTVSRSRFHTKLLAREHDSLMGLLPPLLRTKNQTLLSVDNIAVQKRKKTQTPRELMMFYGRVVSGIGGVVIFTYPNHMSTHVSCSIV